MVFILRGEKRPSVKCARETNGHLLEHLFDDDSRGDQSSGVFRRVRLTSLAREVVDGEDDVLVAEKQVHHFILELPRSNQIAVDRVEKQMRFVLLRLNEQMPFVGQLQIDDWVGQGTQSAQIHAVLHRMHVASAVQRAGDDQIQLDGHGQTRHFRLVSVESDSGEEKGVRLLFRAGVQRAIVAEGEMPDHAGRVAGTGDQHVPGGVQGHAGDDISVMNDRSDHFRLQQGIDAQRPIPMAAAEDELRVVGDDEQTRGDLQRGRERGGDDVSIPREQPLEKRQSEKTLDYRSVCKVGSRSKVKKLLRDLSYGCQPTTLST